MSRQPNRPNLTRDISPSLSRTVISQDRTCVVPGNTQRQVRALRGLMIEGGFYNQSETSEMTVWLTSLATRMPNGRSSPDEQGYRKRCSPSSRHNHCLRITSLRSRRSELERQGSGWNSVGVSPSNILPSALNRQSRCACRLRLARSRARHCRFAGQRCG